MDPIMEKIEKIRFELFQVESAEGFNGIEVEKARAIAQSLLARAEKCLCGLVEKSRWQWVEDSYTSPAEMVEQAETILGQLRKGEYPFLNRFAEIDGIVVDHALIQKDGLHHLIYIRGKACTTWVESPMNNFGHAVSNDLIHWEVKEPVLQCSGDTWDNYQVWAPHIIHHEGEYWMFYTGVNYEVAQAIGLAKSTDLYHWERYEGNPVIRTGAWGNWQENQWSDCRDPMILQDGDRFYAYYCSACKTEEPDKYNYCLGISSSKDLYNWQDEGYALLESSIQTPPESPFVVKRDGKYYLFYTDYKAGTVYATSDHPVKGWKDAPADRRVVVPGISASEVYRVNDRWYISYISHVKNQFHFFEIRELIWHADGKFSLGEVQS